MAYTQQDKKTRLQVIRMIVANNSIESQDELAVELDKAGFSCTQTTLSRDLKQLRISKVRGRSGKSQYVLPGQAGILLPPTREEVNASKWNIAFSHNLCVVHTPPGHASHVAYDIDELHTPFILGTIAGDDTVLVIMSEDAENDKVQMKLTEVVPQLSKKR